MTNVPQHIQDIFVACGVESEDIYFYMQELLDQDRELTKLHPAFFESDEMIKRHKLNTAVKMLLTQLL